MVFASVVAKLGDLFRYKSHHEDHVGHGHEHGRRGAVAHTNEEHDGAHGQEHPHGNYGDTILNWGNRNLGES